MKKTIYLIAILASLVLQVQLFAQTECELYCTVTADFINVCNSAGEVIAADNCADAIPGSLNDLDGFETTTCAFTPDGPGGLPQFCGPGTIVHNNMWIAFTPQVTGRLHLNIEVIECLSTNVGCNGLQAALARALCQNPGNEFYGFEYETLDCVNCVDQTFDLITVDAIAGVTHYVMVDGCCGDACEIRINVVDDIEQDGWSVESVNGTACPDLLSNCMSPNTTITLMLSPNENAEASDELTCDWFAPNGDFLLQQTDDGLDGVMMFSIFGEDPTTGLPYLCEIGEYTAVFKNEVTAWTNTAVINLAEGEMAEISHQIERIVEDDDCVVEEILVSAQPVDPVDILFSTWYKVDYSTDPPTRVVMSEPGSQVNESLLINRNDPTQGDGDYIFGYIGRNDFCISEKLIQIDFGDDSCFADAGLDQVIDCNRPSVTLDASGSCGPTDLVYEWIAPDGIVYDTPTIEVLITGTYTLNISSQSGGCSSTDQVLILENFVEPGSSFQFLNNGSSVLSCEQPSVDILGVSQSGNSFEWIFPSGSTTSDNPISAAEEGIYTLVASNLDNGCTTSSNLQLIYDESIICTGIQSEIYWDENEDCLQQEEEQKLGLWLLEFDNGVESFYRQVPFSGQFNEELEPGAYTVSLIPINETWQACPPVDIEVLTNEIINLDFGAQSIKPCEMPIVEMIIPRLRRCINNVVFLSYSNQGTSEVDDAYIDFSLDEYHDFISADVFHEDLGNQLFRFQLGTLLPFESGIIKIVVKTDCDAPLSLSHCFVAEIYPQNDCFVSPEWDGSSLSVAGMQEDDKINFTVTNEGSDMTTTVDAFIIEDDVLMRIIPLQLNASSVREIPIDCSPSTYRIEVEQSPNHPGMSFPTVSVEGCDGEFTSGLVNQFPQDNEDPHKDVVCVENVDSYDPNDKLAIPVGVTDRKCVAPGRHLDYTIRFQNTGTADALKVVITDVISENLDMRTLKITGASHDYIMTIEDTRTLVFTFDGIDLPWEEKDEIGSNGFVQYSIMPRSDIELGTEVENDALIYFDFNDPIMTNTTFHTIDTDCIEVDLVNNISEKFTINNSVFPNPFTTEFTLTLDKNPHSKMTLKLFDVSGKQLDEVDFSGNKIHYQTQNMDAGIYFYEISSAVNVFGSGRIIKL